VLVDRDEMQERFAVVFREGEREGAGALEMEGERLLLRGRGRAGDLDLEIPFSDLSEVRIGRRPDERLNGYRTLILERGSGPAVYVAPLGLVPVSEIADLLISLSHRSEEDVLAILVPLRPGCVRRARELLAKGPPIDPASLGLTGHDVYLDDDRAIFVFRGSNVRAQAERAFHHPAVWRAGLAWQRCFASAPRIIDPADLPGHASPDYHWRSRQRSGSGGR
jgi:hypothetical protein